MFLGISMPSSSSAKPVNISYGLPSFNPIKAIHFSLLFWKRTTSASSSVGRTKSAGETATDADAFSFSFLASF